MAQSTFHFAVGMAAGTAVAAPSLLQGIRNRGGTAKCFLRWFVLSYGLGFVAIVPSLLRHWGGSESLCRSWWMNVFLFFPLIDGLWPGGLVLGEAAIAAVFVLQYGAMLLMVRRLERLRKYAG